MTPAKKKIGSLSRVGQFLATDAPSSSVFTLHHWSSDQKAAQTSPVIDSLSGAPSDALSYRPRSRRRSCFKSADLHNNHARHVLIKIQESAINFLVRWCLLDESYRLQQTNSKRARLNVANKRQLPHDRSLLQSIKKHGKSRQLREHNFTTFMKYSFWRWLTWINVLELILTALLISCCIHQCYELLEDYYNYPTHVIVSNVLNDNFRNDLPGVTICDNNRISKKALMLNYPDLNTSHYLAMSVGTFYSIDNFSLTSEQPKANYYTQDWYGIDSSSSPSGIDTGKQLLDRHNNDNVSNHNNNSSSLSTNLEISNSSSKSDTAARLASLDETLINWVKVGRVVSKFRPSGHFTIVPMKSIIDSLLCATIGGDKIPCNNLLEIPTLQEASLCRTLFHDAVMWDTSVPSVRELERHLKRKPVDIVFGKIGRVSSGSLFEFDEEADSREQNDELKEEQANEGRLRLEMENMEIIRIRINFNAHDYGNPRQLVGGRLAIHSSSSVGEIVHMSYQIEPGNWYTYYIERSDHQRLPPPYTTNCHDYDANRNNWSIHSKILANTFEHTHKLIIKQANITDRVLPGYGEFLRTRSTGKRECFKMCQAQLSAIKCNCWNPGFPYTSSYDSKIHFVDVNRTLNWCTLDRFKEVQAKQTKMGVKETAADDLFYQACAREYTPICLSACPDECYYSSFEVIQQSRSWPSHEAQRYSEDKRIWDRLKMEAECCATISIIYTSPASTSLVTEPKYTRQDMVTIISGNIEAWLGISAVYAYLAFERFYDALVEAQVIMPPAWARRDSSTSWQQAQQNSWYSSYFSVPACNFIRMVAGRVGGGACCGPIGRFGVTIVAIVCRSFVALSGILISILTKLKLNLTQLFTYLSLQSTIWFKNLKTNK